MRLILTRHAETGKKYKDKYIGATDLPVSGVGLRQAADLADRLADYAPARCISSPMLRTRQTAEVVCEQLQLKYATDKALREIDFGRWEGLSFTEIQQQYPAEVSGWAAEGLAFRFPGGESNAEFWQRVADYYRKVILAADKGPLLLISHGGVIRALICHALGLPFDSYLLFNVQPATFTILEVFDNGGVLNGFNL